jgi:hypothetical protein
LLLGSPAQKRPTKSALKKCGGYKDVSLPFSSPEIAFYSEFLEFLVSGIPALVRGVNMFYACKIPCP